LQLRKHRGSNLRFMREGFYVWSETWFWSHVSNRDRVCSSQWRSTAGVQAGMRRTRPPWARRLPWIRRTWIRFRPHSVFQFWAQASFESSPGTSESCRFTNSWSSAFKAQLACCSVWQGWNQVTESQLHNTRASKNLFFPSINQSIAHHRYNYKNQCSIHIVQQKNDFGHTWLIQILSAE
jgi:hypothetical protein